MTDKSLVETILEHREYIYKQTNCNDISFGELDSFIYNEEDIHEIEIDGYKIRVGIKSVN